LGMMQAPEPGPSTTTPPFGITPDLWAVLACPCAAHGALEPDAGDGSPEAARLVCTVCGLRFPIRHVSGEQGTPSQVIPVMLIESAD